jgi:hypothetical protein
MCAILMSGLVVNASILKEIMMRAFPWFDRRDKDFVDLQKVILNPELLDSFKYYTRFRYRL